jgi:arylsulfatase A-like enzyme
MKPRSLLFLLIATLMLARCGTGPKPRNVLVIAIDTLRSDHLHCYGYGRETSPNIDRLADEGALFENAISQAPWTLPSFGTVFTSLYPTQHGATVVDTRMRTSFPTLASILKNRGFDVAAVVNAPVFRPEFGLGRGFDHYDVPPVGVQRRADETTRAALEWLDGAGDRPFFLFVHYFDPHLSYSPPAPYDTRFDPGYAGPVGRSFDLDYFGSEDPKKMHDEIAALSPADIEHIKALYDGEIAFTDSAVGALLKGLGSRRLADNTLVVILSDHGEEFLDHGGLDHGHSLYGELARVPLIFRFPGAILPHTRIERYVRLLDVTPTILDMLDIDTDSHFEGVSRKPLLRRSGEIKAAGSELVPPDVCYSEALRRTNSTKSVVVPPWKLIVDEEAGDTLLFNIENDPGEKRNLFGGSMRGLLSGEAMLSRCAVGMNDTWYLRIDPGDGPHVFGVTISPARDRAHARVRICQMLNADGAYVNMDSIPGFRASGRALEIKDLRTANELTLAFQTEMKSAPVAFDLTIDGMPAPLRTHIGPSLANPGRMPFSLSPLKPSVRADTEPASGQAPPCFLIWHTAAPYGGPTAARPAESTRKELRALGYIQ